MELSWTLRLKLMLPFLLSTANIICLHGNPITDLHCTNDYLFTINCTVRLAASGNMSGNSSSYRLVFTETFEMTTFECLLSKNSDGDYFCSVKTSDQKPDNDDDDEDYAETFTDADTYRILLCDSLSSRSDTCEVLEAEYAPVTDIKPNVPRCLTLHHNSSQYHFTWRSAYEDYKDTYMVENLMFQLQFLVRDGHGNKVISRDITTGGTEFTADNYVFEPDLDYAARVRSSPNQAHYKGEWSDWSSEVQWKTAADTMTDFLTHTFIPEFGLKVFLPLGLLVPFVFLICYASVKTWKQRTFIPTPAPYFHSLYTECQGNFKSWVIIQDRADMLKAEASLQIDNLTKCVDVSQDQRRPHLDQLLMEGRAYRNLIDSEYNTSLLGFPYAMSTTEPSSAQGSLTLSSQPGNHAEGDLGCWLCSDTSLEGDSPWYMNNYCTLSTFTQTTAITPQHQKRLTTPWYSEDHQAGLSRGET